MLGSRFLQLHGQSLRQENVLGDLAHSIISSFMSTSISTKQTFTLRLCSNYLPCWELNKTLRRNRT